MKRKFKRRIRFFFIILVVVAAVVLCFMYKDKFKEEIVVTNFIASNEFTVPVYDNDYNEVAKLTRGTKVSKYEKVYVKEDKQYEKIEYNGNFYIVNVENLVDNIEDVVKETELYVRTSATVYKDGDSSKILSFVKKGSKVDIIGYSGLLEDGSVTRYKIKSGENSGYVYSSFYV